MIRKILRLIVMVTSLSALAGAQNPNTANAEVHLLPVQGNIYMLVGAVGNITVQVGADGVLMVDTGTAQMSDQVLAAIKQLAQPITKRPIRYIINTHFHA